MKKQIVLESKDIQQALANSFNVDTDNVFVESFYDVDDDGFIVPSVRATIEVPMNDQR